MGQKVHPLGFRVGITKKHQSQWFARFNKYKYAQSVFEDHMLRQTLTDLFPQLLNPVLKKQVRDKNEDISSAKITQIKIERGLIPYEIGIQIHSENCDLIKKSIENLKVNRDLLCHLQKTRRYLQHLRLKFNQISLDNDTLEKAAVDKSMNIAQKTVDFQEQVKSNNYEKRKNNKLVTRIFTKKRSGKNTETINTQKVKLTKQQMRRQRLILKRLKKRQSIRRRYKLLVSTGLYLTKKGNKIIQKFQNISLSNSKKQSNRKKLNMPSIVFASQKQNAAQVQADKQIIAKAKNETLFNNKGQVNQGQWQKSLNIFKSRIKKKFVSILLNRMNKKFLQSLKNIFISSFAQETALGLIYSKKWNFELVKNKLALKPLTQLIKLSTILEEKSLKKMESLRKYYITSGLITKTDALNYYQMLNFLQKLKELISQIKRKQKLQGFFNKNNNENEMIFTKSISKKVTNSFIQKLQTKENLTNVTFNLLSNKFNNIENECRKIQFIEYLKQIVKKHRTNNIYLYLSTIADARKDLRKLQQFTKRNASFLFGTNLDNVNLQNNIPENMFNVIKQTSANSVGIKTIDKTLSEIFLEQIEKQRNMYKDNIQLTPKIAIKFYSVSINSLKTKASFVADSVVDALEKRKAFRQVIKSAKEDLMRTSGVKGVKIQVSGRLNGAEIARSEWVRAGRVPLQTLRANLDYSYKTANTIYGIIGVKVWIFKGLVRQ